MSIRSDLTKLIAEKLGSGYQVTGPLGVPDRVTRRTAVVIVDTISPINVESTGVALAVTVWVLSPKEGPAADDDLDEAVVDMIAALKTIPAVQWTRATRGVLADKHHGYQFELTSAAQITTEPTEPEE